MGFNSGFKRLMKYLGIILHHLLKMEPTQSSETSAYNVRTPGKYPEDNFSIIQLAGRINIVMAPRKTADGT